MRRNSTVSFVDHSDPEPITESTILDGNGLTELLTETNHTMKTYGIDLEEPTAMTRILSDNSSAQMYIDSLAEGLNPEDTRNFKLLANNMLDEMNGKGAYSGQSMFQALTEDNVSAGFLPKAKLIFPMFRFTWPRLHIREITTVIPMDSPEQVRYFFKAVCKNPDNSITPLPSYNPLGNGTVIGTMTDPKGIAVPGTVDLLSDIGATSANTHLEKQFMIIGWEGIDPEGNTVSDADEKNPMLYTTDADGKFVLHINVDPNNKSDYQVVDVISGFVDVRRLVA